jgi:predicted transposase YbfD/YdcC
VSVVSPVLALFDQPTVTQRVLRGQVDGLLEAFASVPDPRDARGVRFPLVVVLGLAQLAVACGAVGFDEIAEVAADLDPELTGAFGLVRSAPSSGTFRRVLNATDPVALDEALCRWAEPPAGESGLVGQVVGRVVSADGKTMRAARRRLESGRLAQDQVVEVLDQATGVVLACQEVRSGDEIGAVEQAMARLADRWGSLAGVVLVADAKHTQHRLVEQVGGAGGWWVLPVKENQPGIYARVTALPWSDLTAAAVERGTGHGRQETRTIRVIQAPDRVDLGLADAAQVIKIGRHVLRKKNLSSVPAWTRESAYFLTSLPAQLADPAALARIVRSHWRIENQLHWVRDTAYDEDRHTARTGNGPVNLACLRNTAISRHRATGADNIRKRLRACARHAHRALEVLTTHQPEDQL